MKYCRKVVLSSAILLGFLVMNCQLFAQERTEVKVKKVTRKSKTLPLDAKLLKLNPTAARTLEAWKKAKKFRLLPNGNFVPFVKTKTNSSKKRVRKANSQNTNIPSLGGDLSLAIDCAKIECPGSFGDDVTCWECH